MDRSSQPHCFCNFCKGQTQLSRYKIKRHVEIYGLSNDSDDLDVASKKLRADSDDDRSSDENSENSDQQFECGDVDHCDLEDDNQNLEEFEGKTSSTEVRFARSFSLKHAA